MDSKNNHERQDSAPFDPRTPSRNDQGSTLNYQLTTAASLRNKLARDLLPPASATPRRLLSSARKQSHEDRDRVTVPPLKLDYLASVVDETPIVSVKQAVQTMQSSMNSSLSSGPAITPRMNPDQNQTDQSLILSPSMGAVREAARAIDEAVVSNKKGPSAISAIRALNQRGSRQRDSDSQQSSFSLNSSIQKDGDTRKDILEKTRKALEEKNQLVASQEKVIRQQEEQLVLMETRLTKRQHALNIIQQSLRDRLSARLALSSPDSPDAGQGDQIDAATSPISEHSPDTVKTKNGIYFSVRKLPLTQQEISPLSTQTDPGLAGSPTVKPTSKDNSRPITGSQQTCEIECQRIIGKEKECWLKVMGLELKIILPEDHEFQANQLPHKDFINKFSQDIAKFLKDNGSEFLNNDTIKKDAIKDNILTNFRTDFNCQVLNESNFLQDNDIFSRSKLINSNNDILTFCHVLRHQVPLVHEPAAASRSNPPQPIPSPAPTAMTTLLTVVAKKGLELFRNLSR